MLIVHGGGLTLLQEWSQGITYHPAPAGWGMSANKACYHYEEIVWLRMKWNEVGLEPLEETIQAVLQEEACSIHDDLHVLQNMIAFFSALSSIFNILLVMMC